MHKAIKYILAIAFLIFSLSITVYEITSFGFNGAKTVLEKADAIIVLGSGYAESAKNRALAGLYLYNKGYAPVVILSGGKTDYPISEAKFMADYIYTKNENALLILEDKSKSTLENLINVYQQIDGKDKNIIIVSDQFHLLRSYILANKIGFKKVQYFSTENIGSIRQKNRYSDNISEYLKIINLLPTLLFGVKI